MRLDICCTVFYITFSERTSQTLKKLREGVNPEIQYPSTVYAVLEYVFSHTESCEVKQYVIRSFTP